MEEDRVYDERRREFVAYVASAAGVATVRVSSDRVGRFSLAERCSARDAAAVADCVYLATDEGVLAGPDSFELTGFGDAFGGAVAVGGAGDPIAASEDGRVARLVDGEWELAGSVADVRAIEADLVGAAGGVYRAEPDGLAAVGLADVRDVAANGAPLAAADDGLYRLGNGWLREREGDFRTVAADADQAHAATAELLYVRVGDDWESVELPTEESVAGVAYGENVYVVTTAGTFLVDADPATTPDGAGGWRSRALGLPDVRAMAVVES